MRPVILTSAYLPPVEYFTKLYGAPYVILDCHDHYVKQTYRNRCLIAGPDGQLALTLPIVHEGKGKMPTRDIRLSNHGDWRHLHWNALKSCYENSPFFEYMADDFLAIYRQDYTYLVDFNAALQELICHWLGLTPDIRTASHYIDASTMEADDFRETIRPKTGYEADQSFTPAPYYQVFQQQNGFIPNLSIVDLLFNMGPEARLVLKQSIKE